MKNAPYFSLLLIISLLSPLSELFAQPHAETTPDLLNVVKIWDEAPHNAFTDLIRFKDHWYCIFREGERHVYGQNGTIRLIASEDGERWESVMLFQEEGVDLRDPKLSITGEGRLMMVAGGSVYRDKELITRQPRVAFSDDGSKWTALRKVLHEGDWLWRVTWHKSRAYGTSYLSSDDPWQLILYTSEDGLDYQPITSFDIPGRPNETTLRFLADDRMIALVRREGDDQAAWIGSSEPPYERWTWHPSQYRVGGPNFIVLPDGSLWAAGRQYGEDVHTVLARFGPGIYEPILALPSSGDTSYPGLAWHDGLLWMSYYSSHEGKSAIYLARIRLPD